MRTPPTRLERAYNAAREPSALVKPDGTVVSNVYDSAGRLAAVVATRGGQEEWFAQMYDSAGRLEAVFSEYDETEYEYDSFLKTSESSDRFRADFEYDDDFRLSKTTYSSDWLNGGSALAEIDVAYDDDGDVVGIGELSIERNPDTGLVEFGCRWYDAETGRWISKDPILLDGGWNVYAFCGNDPINHADPSGLMALIRSYGWSRAIITDVTGKQEILTHFDIRDFRNAISRYPDSSISDITIYDHGNAMHMNIDGAGWGMECDEDGHVVFENDGDAVSSAIRSKLSSGATIYLSGCNTASEFFWNNNNNITKALSKELPWVRVSGNVLPAIGNVLGFSIPEVFTLHVCPLGPTKNWGYRRTYVNGEKK